MANLNGCHAGTTLFHITLRHSDELRESKRAEDLTKTTVVIWAHLERFRMVRHDG